MNYRELQGNYLFPYRELQGSTGNYKESSMELQGTTGNYRELQGREKPLYTTYIGKGGIDRPFTIIRSIGGFAFPKGKIEKGDAKL